MKTLKFIHCADLHLDAPFREAGRAGYADLRRKDIREAFSRIVDRCNEEAADLLLISGDLYEHTYISRKTMDWLCMKLSEVKAPVVIIPGNHDPYLANSWYRNRDWPRHVHILSPEKPYLILEKQRAAIYGIGFSAFREDQPDLSKVPQPKEGYFNILMLHGTLDMDFANQAYKPVSSAALKELGYDYYALGHFHGMREDYALTRAKNPGSPEPLGLDETGEHGAFLAILKEDNGRVSLEIQKFKTAVRAYHDRELHVTGLKSLEEVKFNLLKMLEGLDAQKDLVRITLKGRTELAFDTGTLLGSMPEQWLYLKIADQTRKAYDDALLKDPSLKGAFAREILARLDRLDEALSKEAGNEKLLKEQAILAQALQLGIEALETGRIEALDYLDGEQP